MNKETLYDWLVLHHAPQPGLAKLINHPDLKHDPCALRHLSTTELTHLGLKEATIKALHNPAQQPIECDLAWSQQAGHTILHYGDSNYPEQLREIHSPPIVLFAQGNIELLHCHQIAIVGSRRPTTAGLRNTTEITHDLARSGLVIVSGMALGIDACAHNTALKYGLPTIAVIATGPDLVYPRQHAALSRRIAQHGLILSEFSCGCVAKPNNFPRRNRIISALALGVVVVEASKKSGSLITARHACDQNREVFAIPGSIKNPMVAGCHHLIQRGAKLVQSATDILVELTPMISWEPDTQQTQQQSLKTSLEPQQYKLLMQMTHDTPTSIDTLIEQSGLPTATVLALLSALELRGLVSQQNSFYMRLL